jgi:hypothetical protein
MAHSHHECVGGLDCSHENTTISLHTDLVIHIEDEGISRLPVRVRLTYEEGAVALPSHTTKVAAAVSALVCTTIFCILIL